MWPIFSFARLKQIAFGIVVLLAAILFLAYSGNYVRANWTVKHATLAPKQVVAEGWNNPNAALVHELGESAALTAFTTANSASIDIQGIPKPEKPVVLPEEPIEEDETETKDENLSETENATTSATTTPVTNTSVAPTSTPSAVTPPAATSSPEILGEATSTETAPETSPVAEPEPSDVGTTSPATTTDEVSLKVPNPLLRYFGTPAFAQEESAATNQDVALCVIAQRPCHLIEFEGFEIPAGLKEKKLEGFSIAFSFASRYEDGETDDRLVVRYFHEGAWREAGEVFLNKEHSNAANGGYFIAELPELTEWDDVTDLRVVVEYDRVSDERGAYAFLDAVWIDAAYKDRPQDFDAGDILGTVTEIPETLDPLLDEAPATEPLSPPLIFPNGESILFGYINESRDKLVMRADKIAYFPEENSGRDTVQVSVTNTGKRTDTFQLHFGFPEGNGDVAAAYRFMQNVPIVTEEQILEEVLHACESLWESATSSGNYTCDETGETLACSWLAAADSECVVVDEVVGTQVTTEYTSDWIAASTSESSLGLADLLDSSYKITDVLDGDIEILPGQTLYFKVSVESAHVDPFLVVRADGDAYSGVLDTSALVDEAKMLERAKEKLRIPKKRVNELLSDRTSFSREELPEFKFQFKSQRNVVVRAFRWLFRIEIQPKVGEVVMVHRSGKYFIMPADVTYNENGEWQVRFTEQPNPLMPGEYTMLVKVEEDGIVYEDAQTFSWGVLALNTLRSVYAPGEEVNVHLAALSQNGNTICDADLALTVVAPNGTSTDLAVTPSGECYGNNVVNVPDYTAQFTAGEVGSYTLILTRYGASGEVAAQMTDSFEVYDASDIPLIVERKGPTRIYPVEPYAMEITVTATEDFEGTAREVIPADFDVTGAGFANDGVNLTWQLSLKAGESKTLRYTFDAADRSPYLYIAGPMLFADEDGEEYFTELRAWQVASDAAGNMVLLWDNASSIPTGWTCVSCTAGDAFYQRFVMGSSTYGGTGGAATHTHTATGAITAGGTAVGEQRSGTGFSGTGHTHTYSSPTFSSPSNLPPYRQLRFIQSVSAGEPTDIPAGAIAVFDAAVPSGWTRYSAQDNYFVRGETTVGTTAGSSTHEHLVSGNTGVASGDVQGSRNGAISSATDAHTHAVTASTTFETLVPPYLEVVLGQLDATTTPSNYMIAMWTGDAPTGWNNVSGTGQAFNGNFFRGSATYGTSGGTTTHSHGNISTTTGVASATGTVRSGTPNAAVNGAHTHAVNVTNINSTSHLPPYIEVPFAQRLANIPVYTQTSYLWYVNANAEPPTDQWPSGATNLGENVEIPDAYNVDYGNVLRLRIALGVTNASSTVGGDAFKLQFAAGSSCSASLDWHDVGAIGSTTAAWRGFNNGAVADGATVSSTTISISTKFATYEEENNSATVPVEIPPGQYGEWDWVIQSQAAEGGTEYCFRMIRSDGSALNAYTRYPKLITNSSPDDVTMDAPFSNEKIATTTPDFDFYAEDPEIDSIDYHIQVSTDATFASTVIDVDSVNLPNDFDNVLTPEDKAPFNSGDLIRYTVTSALSDGQTYWWRIRAKDTNGSNSWGDWATGQSFTIDTNVTIATWHQTTDEQFDTDTRVGTQSSGSDTARLIVGSTTGTLSSSAILFEWGENASTSNAWGELSWSHTETSSDLDYAIEYFDEDSTTWIEIPDSVLPGNAAGFDTAPVNLLGVSPVTYPQIRIRADFTNSGATPVLNDWTVEWGTRVSQPTLYKLFDNEKTGTTTPSFEFLTTDPQGDELTYEIQWTSDHTFGTGTTSKVSDTDSGFTNVTAPGDPQPYISGNRIRFTVQSANALTDGQTYWWRVRAKDPSGGNAYSEWSDTRSFTVDVNVTSSTWFQTTDAQFDTDALLGLYSVANSVQVATSVSDVLIAYGEGTTESPRYRLWDGDSWGSEQSAESVNSPITWVVTKPHPQANSYALATMGTNGNIYAQIYEDGAWDNLQLLTSTVSNINTRGFDIAYETLSGDVIAVYCDGDSNPSYRVWDGATWSSATSIVLSATGDCEWIRLASDPVSDEIILVSLPSGGTAYEAQVWNGSAWGNSTTWGSMTESNEGIGLEYEESGGQAIAIVSNGNSPNVSYQTWSGSAWSGAANQNLGGMEWAMLRRNVGSDVLALCFVDDSTNAETIRWSGSAWTGAQQLDATANRKTDRPIDCAYETTSGRSNYVMAVYSDATNARYQFYNGTTWSGEASVSTIEDAATIQVARASDGVILATFFDHTNGRYDFSWWNGASWATAQTLESSPSVTATPFKEPFMMAARNSAVEGSVTSDPVVFTEGSGPKWGEISWTDSEPGGSSILYQVEYLTASSTWELIPDGVIPGNSSGTSTNPISLDTVNTSVYGTIRLVANMTCSGGSCPTLSDWSVTWAEGLLVSGTAKQYDQTTDVTSGTVAIAVNGSLQVGKTGTIAAGAWTISNVTVFAGDVITVFIDGAAAGNRAVAVTKYDGDNDVTGIELFERHLSIGSADNKEITNANISLYDNTSGDSDIFVDVDAANDLTGCAVAGCEMRLYVQSGDTYRPDSSSSGNVSVHDMMINGTTTADGNTFTVSGSWDNNNRFSADTSTVIFTATSTTETVDSTGATASSFNTLTFGQTSGAATWNLGSTLDVNGNFTVNFGTTSPGTNNVTLAQNLTFGASGAWQPGSGTTTFDGTGTWTWTDNTVAKQDMGTLAIDGTSKTIGLGANAKATNIFIGADDTFTAGTSFSIEVLGNWTNNNSFVAQSGTVTFSATTTGKTIAPGNSSFNNIVFNGSGGNWAFNTANVTANNNFTITAGTVTMPTGTTTVAGSFNASSGTFMHNNGTVYLTAASAKTVQPGASSFYDLTFNGTGSWTFPDANATSSRQTRLMAGTMTAPPGTFAIGGSFLNTGGTFTHGSGTLRFTSASAASIRLNGSSAYNLTFAGSGSWGFLDTNATTTDTLRVESGTVTLPSGTFAVGGSWLNTAGTVTHNSGTVIFNATTTGKTIQSNGSWFSRVVFNGANGGWTVTESATSSATTTLAAAASFTLSSGQTYAVGGGFSNGVASTTTTWTGSTLYLYSGTSYSINTKTAGGDTYGTIALQANTKVKTWHSSADSFSVPSSAYLYSQDHANVDGDLYIWGTYAATGSETWSYATDFDGTALAGASRQVDVRFAANSVFSFPSGTLAIVGTSTATTTIANQGSGSYSFTMSGGTLNAQYYSVKNTDANGIALSGTPTVTTLSDGDYELSVLSGGTMLTIAGSVIDQNPLLQIQRNSFATSTGVTDGSNVTVTGSPSSYWWYRNHYGNYDGENFDTDPSGNPGNVRWDDSGLDITVSGTVYSDHGNTPIGNPPCDGSTAVVRVVVSGGASYSGSCNAGTGAYSIPNVIFTGDVVLTVYLDTAGGRRAATVTKTPTGDLTDIDLYENALIVRHEDTAPLSITDLAAYDFTDDPDIPFTAATGSPNTLTTKPDTELYIWEGKTFAPGGNMSLESGGSGDARDGRLFVATSSTFTAAGSESHSLGGGITFASSTSVFTAANSTFTLNATTSGKLIDSKVALSFYNLTFNGSGGGWSLASTATTTVQNSLILTAGTLSGTGTVVAQSGDLTGNGVIAMTGGTFVLEGVGNLGSDTAWQFNNLTLGSGAVGTTTKTGTATTTVTGILKVRTSQIFEAGSAAWVLSGGGTPFVVDGTFDVDTASWYYTATSATNVADETYNDVFFAPSAGGTPVYAIMGGTFTADDIFVGGANPVSLTIDSNDPTALIGGDVTIGGSSTLTASNVGIFRVGGSWTNNGTFTPSGGTLTFNSTDTGETITAGNSSFASVVFNASGGGWTVSSNATTTAAFTLTSASSFTLSPLTTLSVGGTFTNSVGGAATDWTGSMLSLISGTSYSTNAKTVSDTYGVLYVGANTDVRMWQSSAATTNVHASGSLYSQDHAGVDGSLYIWGEYVHSTGSDYWSHGTDFDGASLTGSERAVAVRIASSSSVTHSGGVFDMIGAASATTTVAVQGSGAYAFTVSGGTMNASYYQFRNVDATGLNFTGSPTVTALSDGDFELSVDGGSMMTVAGATIDANPLKIIQRVGFATSSGISSGYNVTEVGTPTSAWVFDVHYGNYDGEAFDNDPAGDPGYLLWDDSAGAVTIAGNVYSDEGTTVSSVCDGSTQVVRLRVQGGGDYTSSCSIATGAYSIPNISYNPGDLLSVFLDTDGGARAVNVSVDPVTSIFDMHLYENRVIVRHEDSAPITIADMAIYDSSDDSDVFYTAVDAGTDTLTLPPETKLIVWNSKTFAPAGNITLQSGGSGEAWDGTLEVRASGSLTAAGTQSHSIGGSFILGSSATFTSGNSTLTFTATTTGKTITPQNSAFYNVTFNGSGGNWAFSGSAATSTNDFTISNGTVTMPTATTTIGGSFLNSGGTFMHNNGVIAFTSTAGGKTVQANGSNFYTLLFNGTGGAWTMSDTNATSSNNVTIAAGGVTLPAGTFAVGSSFRNTGGSFTHSSGSVRLTASSAGKSVQAGGSNFYNLRFDGSGGEWTFADSNATTTNDMTIVVGSTTLPSGTIAVGGSFVNGGSFAHNSGTVRLNATATGKFVTASTSSFYNLILDSASGGWTVTQSATTSNNFTLANAASFTLASGQSLGVSGTFTNSVGGTATTWDGTTLYLNSGSAYTVGGKTVGVEYYENLLVGANTDVTMWNSVATTTGVDLTGSLYSQDHANIDGDLYIWGDYQNSTSAYWSYATDFDGTALGGGSRQVDVRIASSSTITLSGATVNLSGISGATTTIAIQGSGAYAFDIAAGTLAAQYYSIRNTDFDGLNISGSTIISTLDNGDFELGLSGGTMLTLAEATINANATFTVSDVRFATSSGITGGYNVTRTGSPLISWTFIDHYGNYDGEAFDNDGGDTCGSIRWDDSLCLFVSQEHFRWRSDDGGEGAPSSDWYNASWSKRKRIGIENQTATPYTGGIPVKVVVDYHADMQSDFDDLRFTDSSGTTSLPYWVEEFTASASSTVWVRVPTLPANGDAIVYVYYGNAGATNAEDGENTFDFFDDFEDDDISEYTGSTSLFNVGTSFAYEGTYGLDALGNESQKTTASGGIRQTGTLVTQGDTVRFFQYIDSTEEDEPCTLFGVQGSGQNYAVCLDQFPIGQEKVHISENVVSNEEEGSGTVLASTTVTFDTGWYEVEVDWLTDNSINVTVYDDTGAVFATVSTSDSSYTSGGVGFSYWGQNGGWDFYSVRAYTATDPTYVFGIEQINSGASWRNDEDSAATAVEIGEDLRLRFSIQNSGTEITNQNFRLNYAEKGASLNCESVSYNSYTEVPITGNCGTEAACMIPSNNFADQTDTTPLLSYPASMLFTSGKLMEDSSNESNALTVPSNTATEVEYAIEMTNYAVQNSYCFRVTEEDTDLDNYDRVAEVVLTHAPTITNFAFNNGEDITLTEGTTTTVSATGTVTDLNGYDDIVFATSTFYRSGVGPACTASTTNCYHVSAAQCTLSGCSGNSCTLQCSADIYFFADATDAASSTYPSENWLARVYVEDEQGESDTSTSLSVELLTLYGLSVAQNIDYGSLYVGEDSPANATTTIVNTGNSNIDIRLSGTDLSGTGSTIDVDTQKYATTSFAYSACAICNLLTGSATELDVDLPRPSSTSSPVTDEVYWGITIPVGTAGVPHSGVNYFEAVADQ